MKELKKISKNGITLIALVITIVVLLILAGVSINAIVGENGILNHATESSIETNKQSSKEQIEMEIAGSYDDSGKIDVNVLKDNLKNNLGIDTEILEDTLPFCNIKLNGFDFSITKKGEVVIGNKIPFAENIDVINYGDYVNYPVDLGIKSSEIKLENNEEPKTDWRIFYHNDDRVFLITSDYVSTKENTLLKVNELGLTTANSYNGYWSQVPTKEQNVNEIVKTLFKTNWNEYSGISGRCISTMLNTDNWNNFINTSYADYAIGGSTLDMWCLSYSAKGYQKLYTSKNDYGFLINNVSDCNLSNDSGYNDSLYFPHKSIIDNSNAYWISSPASHDSDAYIINIRHDGHIELGNYDNSNRCFRPIVALNSSISATQNEEGIWELESKK